MTRIEWQTADRIRIGAHSVPISADLQGGDGQSFGLRRERPLTLAVKRMMWPFKKLRDDLLIDGFIETETGKLIRKYRQLGDTYLEIGCGDMSLRRFVPRGEHYNALDIAYSEFQLRRNLDKTGTINPVIASATAIPAESGCASLIISTETLTNIPDIEAALAEMRRVAAPNARLVISIPNEKCRKYQVKGDNSYMRHKWSFDEFVALMAQYGFRMLEGFQKGYWVRTPNFMGPSYHLPIRSENEAENVNFFFVFELDGDSALGESAFKPTQSQDAAGPDAPERPMVQPQAATIS